MNDPFVFCCPPMNFIGEGAQYAAISHVAKSHRNALFVCDAFLFENGLANQTISLFKERAVIYHIFSQFHADPTWKEVLAGVTAFKSNECDLIISLGGGSAHDCAKAIAFFTTNQGELTDYLQPDQKANCTPKLMCINTTAGTGAETTRVSIITDEQQHIKRILLNYQILPLISVNDPSLMLNQPQMLAAATGIDALTHAIESYLSKNHHLISDALALQAISIILHHLIPSLQTPDSLPEKECVASAAMMAGLATNAGLGYVHALAHQIGGIYGIQHGVCCARLLPPVLRWIANKAPERLAALVYQCGQDTHSEMKHNVEDFIFSIDELIKNVGIGTSLEMLGVKRDDFPQIINNALLDICSQTAILNPGYEDYLQILSAEFE